jgi:hypothetical protein
LFSEDENGEEMLAAVTIPGGATFDIVRPIEIAERNGDLIVIYEVESDSPD